MTSQTVDRLQERYVTINSADRIYGSSSDFKVLLTDSIISLRRFRLLHACIPYTFYDIDDSSVLLFQEQAGGGVVTAPLYPGNYTPATLATALATTMTGASPNGYTYNVTFDSSTLKYDIATAGAQKFKILWTTMYNYNFNNTGKKNNLPYQLGFANASDNAIPDPDTGFSDFFISTGAGAISYRNNLWIVVQPQFPNRILNTSNASISYVVPVNGNFGDKLFFDINSGFDLSLYYAAHGSTSIVELNITVRDEDNTILDLNGVDCSFLFGYTVYE